MDDEAGFRYIIDASKVAADHHSPDCEYAAYCELFPHWRSIQADLLGRRFLWDLVIAIDALLLWKTGSTSCTFLSLDATNFPLLSMERAWALLTTKQGIHDGLIPHQTLRLHLSDDAPATTQAAARTPKSEDGSYDAFFLRNATTPLLGGWSADIKLALHESRHHVQEWRARRAPRDDYEKATLAFAGQCEKPVDWSPYEVEARFFQNVVFVFADPLLKSLSDEAVDSVARVHHLALSAFGGKFGTDDFPSPIDSEADLAYAYVQIARHETASVDGTLRTVALRHRQFLGIDEVWHKYSNLHIELVDWYCRYYHLPEGNETKVAICEFARSLMTLGNRAPGTIILQAAYWEYVGYSLEQFARIHPELPRRTQLFTMAAIASYNALVGTGSTRHLKYISSSLFWIGLLNGDDAVKQAAERLRGFFINYELASSTDHWDCCLCNNVGATLSSLMVEPLSESDARFLSGGLHEQLNSIPVFSEAPDFSSVEARGPLGKGITPHTREILCGVLRFAQRAKEVGGDEARQMFDFTNLTEDSQDVKRWYRGNPMKFWMFCWAWAKWQVQLGCSINPLQNLGWNYYLYFPRIPVDSAEGLRRYTFDTISRCGAKFLGEGNFLAILDQAPATWLRWAIDETLAINEEDAKSKQLVLDLTTIFNESSGEVKKLSHPVIWSKECESAPFCDGWIALWRHAIDRSRQPVQDRRLIPELLAMHLCLRAIAVPKPAVFSEP